MQELKFCPADQPETLALGGGSSRRVLCHDEHMLCAQVICETGGAGPAHRHPHSQISYILSGAFNYTIEGVTHEMHAGDSIVVAPNELHGCVCLEAGTLLDVFTPCREDFLK